jgi:hypothetical protein
MRTTVLRLLLAAVACAGGGCASVYVPPPAPTPLFREAGELQVGGAVGARRSLAAQVAWAPLRHVGLIGSGWGCSTDDQDERRLEGELGAGTWFEGPWGFRLEGFGGLGAGSVRVRDEVWPDEDFAELWPFPDHPLVRGRLERAFGQVNVGRADGVIEYGLATRLAALRFDPKGEAGPGRAAWTLEPVAFLRAGPGWLQGEAQFGSRVSLRGELPAPHEGPPLFVWVGARAVFGRGD